MRRMVGRSLKIISLALLLTGIAPLLHSQNPGQTCSLSTLKGYYSMQSQGTVLQYPIGNPPFPLAEAARDYFDGAGNFRGRFVANGGGGIVQGWLPARYSVNADCTGTITASGLTMSFVVLADGSLRGIDTSNWLVVKRTWDPISKGKHGYDCSLGTLKGTYSIQGEGTVVAQMPGWPTPPFTFTELGRYVLDGAGNISGNYTWNAGGTIMTGTVTGTYQKVGTCIGTMTLDEGGTAVNEFFAVFGNGNLRLVQTDSWITIARTMERMPD